MVDVLGLSVGSKIHVDLRPLSVLNEIGSKRNHSYRLKRVRRGLVPSLVLAAGRKRVQRNVIVRLRGQLDEVNCGFTLLLRGGDLRSVLADGAVQAEPLPQHGIV